MKFDYVIEKIRSAEFQEFPFRHIEVQDVFEQGDFQEITNANEVKVNELRSDTELFQRLIERGYRIIEHPGCSTSLRTYKKWRNGKADARKHTNTACEGFGVAYRLIDSSSKPIQELLALLHSDEFQGALASRFQIDLESSRYDAGIQKYLDGYEISPHHDIRRKALTFMANINPCEQSDQSRHHTHYLRLKSKYKYVKVFWEHNPEMDRCWVPWEWCDSCKVQKENNSLVIFQPDDSTMHGVKATYDHLGYQRTQLYGNLWYENVRSGPMPSWEDLLITESTRKKRISPRSLATAILPAAIKQRLKSALKVRRARQIFDRDI